MKTTVWTRCILALSLGLLLFLNGYTLFHAVTGYAVAFGVVLLLLLWVLIRGFLERRSDRFLRGFTAGLWLLIILLQVSYVFLLHNNVRYDAYWVVNQAVEMLDTHAFSDTISNGYFTQVPNNYGLTLITYWFLRLVRALGVPASGYMRALQLFNTLFIDLSVLFIFLIIRRVRSGKDAVYFLLFCALTPWLYVWTPYYYTSTTSMMFGCAALWIWLCIRDASSRRRQLLLSVLLGVVCVTGFKVRATSLIPYIAIGLYWTMHHKKGALRQALRPMLVFVLSAGITFIAWKGIIAHYVPFDTTDTALPVTHFIMMGTQADGSFNQDDLRYSISLATKEEKLAGTLSVIRERLAANGFTGNLQLLLRKQLNGWVNGTALYPTENGLCTEFHLLHIWISGSKARYLTSYAQMIRCLHLLLTCIYALLAWQKKRVDGIFLLALNLLGGMVFHLLWEASPLYSIAFTLYAYAVSTETLTRLYELSRVSGRSRMRSAAALLAVSCVCLLSSSVYLAKHWSAMTRETSTLRDYVVNQHMETIGEAGPELSPGSSWVQTFTASQAFNAVDLYFENPNAEQNSSVYRITLTDAAGTAYLDTELHGNETGYDLCYEFTFAEVLPEGETTYYLSIEPLIQDEDNYIRFESQDCRWVDLYPQGTLLVSGTDSGRDLAFRVVSLHIGTQATKKEYCAFALLLTLLELFLIVKALLLIHEERRTVPGRVQGSPDVLAQESQHHHDDAEGK